MCPLGATEPHDFPAAQLRLVHGLICASEQVRGILDPVPCSRAKGAEDALRQSVAKTPGEATNAECIRARRKDAELVATQSSEEVPTGAGDELPSVRDFHQQVVTGPMAKAVVHRLEAVHIHHRYRQRCSGPPGAIQFLREPL